MTAVGKSRSLEEVSFEKRRRGDGLVLVLYQPATDEAGQVVSQI